MIPPGGGPSSGRRPVRRRAAGHGRIGSVATALFLAACAGGEPARQSEPADVGAIELPAPDISPTPVETPSIEIDVIEDDDRWMTGSSRREHGPVEMVTVTDIRVAAHDDFDRFVIAIDGDAFPTHHGEMSTAPAIQCGSGEPVTLPGSAVLTFRIEPARAHDEAGSSTLEVRDLRPRLPAILEARLICDFEGQVEWAFGIANATAFRILELTDPSRIVIDVQH